jgi:hypothetical protein
MAILGKSFDSMFTDDITFQSFDYAIGGKMVVGRAEMDESFVLMMEDGDETAIMQVKEKLTRDLVHFMLENRLVEFTHHDDPSTMKRKLAVRAYLAPSDQVRILRLSNQL